MKNLIILLCLTFCYSGFSQSKTNVSIFHRLIIYNSDNEIMVVKIKNTDIWVTPGFYQDSVQFIKKGLHDIAATYGMKISNPELKGMFSMRREHGAKQEILIRNIYHCNYLSGKIHFPENQPFELDEIKWLPVKTACSLISFESIRMFIKQTDKHSNEVSGGSIHAKKEGKNWKYEIIEPFYSLFKSKKRKKRRKKQKKKRKKN